MADALAPGATAGKRNLYEWEKGQVYWLGTFRKGQVKLSFVDASTSGDDVFVRTEERLDPRYDTDAVKDIYDIRVGGGFADPPVPPVPCDPTSGSCQGPAQPVPGAVNPPSQSFSGPGNPPTPLPARNPHKAKKHHKKAHKRRGARSANSSHGGGK